MGEKVTKAEIIQIIIGVLSLIVTVFVSFFIYWLQVRHKNHKVNELKASGDETEKIIDSVLKSTVNPLLFDDCKVVIVENSSIGWHLKESEISKIRVALSEVLCKFCNNDRFFAKQQAIQLTDRIISAIKKNIPKS